MQAKLCKFVKSLRNIFLFKSLLRKNPNSYAIRVWKLKKNRDFHSREITVIKIKNQDIKSRVARFEIRIMMCHKNFYILTRGITQNVWNWCRWGILEFFNFFYAFGNNKKFLRHISNNKKKAIDIYTEPTICTEFQKFP